MGQDYDGRCSCGAIKVRISLAEPIEVFESRACDCDFCTERGIEYLSDPRGALFVSCSTSLVTQRQGSNQASFVTCSQCNDVIAAVFEKGGTRIGSLNAILLDDYKKLKGSQIVSPKQLTAEEKATRWKSIWFPVHIN